MPIEDINWEEIEVEEIVIKEVGVSTNVVIGLTEPKDTEMA